MRIYYPPLVEQGFSYFSEEHQELSRDELYLEMVRNQLITETGMPTNYALENGFIKDFFEEENLSITEFLALYPVFKKYNQDSFKNIDGFWEITIAFKEELKSQLNAGVFNYDERVQLEEYLESR